MTNPSPDVHINLGKGFSGKALAYVSIGCLALGLIGGVWGSFALFHYEPSEEYTAMSAKLEVQIEMLGDSLEDAREATAEALEEVAEVLASAEATSDELEGAREVANQARAGLDRLRDGSGDTISLTFLRQERDMLREALGVREQECLLCARAIQQRDLGIAALQAAVTKQNREMSFLMSENNALAEANEMANAEIHRASRRIPKWYKPTITTGVGCTIGVIGGSGCGPSVAIGFQFSLF